MTTYLLILPAITMEHSTLEVTATPSEAVLGETIDTEIYAEAEDGREETFFVISADGDNAGLDESQFGFDEDGIAVIEDVGGQAIKLHREYDEDGVVCYWFTLSEGQSAQFTLPWINGVDRYRTEIVEEEVLIEIEEEMPDSLPTETETIPEEIAPGEEVSSEEATVESVSYTHLKLSPGLRMIGKPFHKTGITVFASVSAAHIRIHSIITDGKVCLCDHAFGIDFFYYHIAVIPFALLRAAS